MTARETMHDVPDSRDAPLPRRTLGRSLAVATLLVSTLIAAIVIALQITRAYANATAQAHQLLDEIGTGATPAIAESLWQVDDDRVQLLMDSLMRLHGVAYVEVTGIEGERYSRGETRAKPFMIKEYPLQAGQRQEKHIGALRVVLGSDFVTAQLVHDATAIVGTSVITIAASAIAILLLVRAWVTRRLDAMVEHARSLSLETLSNPMSATIANVNARPDELDELADTFNIMCMSLAAEFMLQERSRQELIKYQGNLEAKVRERTEELAEKTRVLQVQKDEMERLANTDSLTGVSSRRHFEEVVANEIARSKRSGAQMSLALLDIDHFKRINDSYGHGTGDAALVTLCDTCRHELRGVDTIGRVGGEEFAILLPDTDIVGARFVAERIRKAVAGAAMSVAAGGTLAFTVSIGVATVMDAAMDVDALFRAADDALYQAKNSGRNRVCISSMYMEKLAINADTWQPPASASP